MRDNNIRWLYSNPNLHDNLNVDIEPKPRCLGSKINKVSNHDSITNLRNMVSKKCASINAINSNNSHFTTSLQQDIRHNLTTLCNDNNINTDIDIIDDNITKSHKLNNIIAPNRKTINDWNKITSHFSKYSIINDNYITSKLTSLDPNYFNVDTTDKVNNNIVLNNTLLYNKINDANTKTANISNTTTIGVAVHIGNIMGQDNITTSNLQSDDNFF